MAWQYHKRIKIIPGIHLDFNGNSFSASIAVKDAGLQYSEPETAFRSGRNSLPGSGYNSLNPAQQRAAGTEDNIFSADLHAITSQGMQGIKEAILMAHQQRKELEADLLKVQAGAAGSRTKLAVGYLLLYGLLIRSISRKIKADIAAQEKAITQLKHQVRNCHVTLDIDFAPVIKQQYDRVIATFQQLAASHKIWDVTAAHHQDRVAARSNAATVVNKREVSCATRSLNEIKSATEALYFQNANGADIYIYPAFVVMYSSKTSFAIIGLDELDFHHTGVHFTETGSVPPDSKIIDRTWYKVNKNGTPDKRFNGNYQIPVVRYGQINLGTATGLNEEYEFSNYEATDQFGQAFSEYLAMFRRLRKR